MSLFVVLDLFGLHWSSPHSKPNSLTMKASLYDDLSTCKPNKFYFNSQLLLKLTALLHPVRPSLPPLPPSDWGFHHSLRHWGLWPGLVTANQRPEDQTGPGAQSGGWSQSSSGTQPWGSGHSGGGGCWSLSEPQDTRLSRVGVILGTAWYGIEWYRGCYLFPFLNLNQMWILVHSLNLDSI